MWREKIEMKEYLEYKQDEIVGLYKGVGWINYTDNPERLKNGYRNSLYILGAYEGDKLVGIIRTVGDGVTIVFIQDLLVLPEYQHKGIGTMLIKAIIEKYKSVYQMELVTDNTEKTIAFYQTVGFTPFHELGCFGFMRV